EDQVIVRRQRRVGAAILRSTIADLDLRGGGGAAPFAAAAIPDQAHAGLPGIRLCEHGEGGEAIAPHDDEPFGLHGRRRRRAGSGAALGAGGCAHLNALSSFSVTFWPMRTCSPMNAPVAWVFDLIRTVPCGAKMFAWMTLFSPMCAIAGEPQSPDSPSQPSWPQTLSSPST